MHLQSGKPDAGMTDPGSSQEYGGMNRVRQGDGDAVHQAGLGDPHTGFVGCELRCPRSRFDSGAGTSRLPRVRALHHALG